MLGCELWWHYSGVTQPLMRRAKWVQSIKCGGDGCFIYSLPLPTQWQTFLPFLHHMSNGLHGQTSALPRIYLYPLVPWARQSSRVLWLCFHVYSEASLTKPSKVCPFCLKLCPHILVLSFPSSHRAFWGHASGLLSEFSCWVLGLRAGPFCFSPLGFQTPNWALAQCP